MKIELTDKELFDIEWSILVAISTVEKQKKTKESCPLVNKLLKLHDLIAEKRKTVSYTHLTLPTKRSV